MTPHVAPRLAATVALGIATGGVFLGAGGRVAMRIFALAVGRLPTFTVRGTLTVVLYGAIAGAIGALVLLAVARWLPKRPWLRGVVFSALCYLLASPGFRPPQLLVFALFAPAFLAYGLSLTVACPRPSSPGRFGFASSAES